MDDVIIDTNVAVVANDAGKPPDDTSRRPVECIEACVDELLAVTNGDRYFALDAGGLIFEQYRTYLSLAGQPGPGDVFMKWVHDHQWEPDRCTRVAVTEDADRAFAEFPDDASLQGFDWDDRVFIAVAVAHPGTPIVLQAVDAKWRPFVATLSTQGVRVQFVCR
jgi:hypothetical protein